MPTDFTPYYWTIYSRVSYHFPHASVPDVVQEAYRQIQRYYGDSTRDVHDPVALLWTVAKRVAIKARRRRAYDMDSKTGIRDPPSATLEPWQVLAQKETVERLSQALSELRPTYASVIKAHYFDGRSCTELATEYGVSREVIKMRLLRGRRQLRTALARARDS